MHERDFRDVTGDGAALDARGPMQVDGQAMDAFAMIETYGIPSPR